MAHIETPPPSETVKSLDAFIRVSGDWHKLHAGQNRGMLSDLWYRGTRREFDNQAPGVYRQKFTERAQQLDVKGGAENKRLRLERNMISQFPTAGAQFLHSYILEAAPPAHVIYEKGAKFRRPGLHICQELLERSPAGKAEDHAGVKREKLPSFRVMDLVCLFMIAA